MAITQVTLENFQSEVSKSEKPVLLDFYADWCGPCKVVSSELEAFAEENDTVKVCKIDTDTQAVLASMYGILSIPTLLLVRGGKEFARHAGGCEKQDIADFVAANL